MKRILLISDVKGWGGWVRAEYIKKYLSDEFDFTLMDATEFNKLEKSTSVIPYDLVYLLFHTMLNKKTVQRLLHSKIKIVTIVTVFPTLRKIFYGRGSSRNPEKARKYFLKLANRCKAIFANNYKSLEDLRYIYNPRKTYYMPRGVDPDIFYPDDKPFKRKNNEDNFTVAYVGKPNPEKGLKKYIIPACREAKVKLITNERNFTNALSESEMREFYNNADVYIVASTMDGTPNTALEAASCGKPILANEIGNMPEFIRDGENGFLVPLEIKKYVNKLKWMKINQKRTWQMGKEARETILRDWTWQNVINRNERKVFRSII